MQEPGACDEARLKSSSRIGRMPCGTHYPDILGVKSNGSLDESHHRNVTEMCQRAFLSIILSEKFTTLCKLLFENFQGMKADGLFSISIINRRMTEGAYEHFPTLFYEDIEQVICTIILFIVGHCNLFILLKHFCSIHC